MTTFFKALIRSHLPSVARNAYRVTGVDFVNSQAQSVTSSVRQLHASSARNGSVGGGFHHTSDFDKKILVWTKMYPDVNSVPKEVTNAKMKKAKDIFRIRVSIMMALGTILLCIVYIKSGKDAVGRGETIHTMNKDRHSEHEKLNK